jgi:hypothetical protein
MLEMWNNQSLQTNHIMLNMQVINKIVIRVVDFTPLFF